MKKLISLIIICFAYTSLHAQTLCVKVDSLSASINRSDSKIANIDKSIDELSIQVENLTYLVEVQKEIIGHEQSAIENCLNGTTLRIDIFAIVLAVAGIILGVYISRKEKSMKELLAQVEKLEGRTSKTKDDIVELNDNINSDIEGLYDRLKKEETASLFRRLVEVPWDISNIGTLLLARKVDISNFKYLTLAYRNLKDSGTDEQIAGIGHTYKDLYLLQFFQHFCGQSISHTLIKDDLIEFLPRCLSCAYQGDVEYSTNSLIICLNRDKSIENKSKILYTYIKALNESKHNTISVPYEIIVSKYNNDDDLIQVWEKLVANNIIIKQYGEPLCDRFLANSTFVSSVKEKIEKRKTDNKDESESK